MTPSTTPIFDQKGAQMSIAMSIDIQGADLELYISSNGEFFLDKSLQLPLADEFRTHGAEAVYDTMRAEIIARMWDAVMPAEVVDKIASSPIEKDPSVKEERAEPSNVVTRLVVPRLHYRETGVPKPDHEKGSRELRYHGVVYHKRRLAKGQFASPAAIAMAREVGWELAENETFVRAHSRGSKEVGYVAAHELVVPPKQA